MIVRFLFAIGMAWLMSSCAVTPLQEDGRLLNAIDPAGVELRNVDVPDIALLIDAYPLTEDMPISIGVFRANEQVYFTLQHVEARGTPFERRSLYFRYPTDNVLEVYVHDVGGNGVRNLVLRNWSIRDDRWSVFSPAFDGPSRGAPIWMISEIPQGVWDPSQLEMDLLARLDPADYASTD